MSFIGLGVVHAHRKDNKGNYSQHGVIVGKEGGCNGGLIVRWDRCIHNTFMVASDCAVMINGRWARLDFCHNEIILLKN